MISKTFAKIAIIGLFCISRFSWFAFGADEIDAIWDVEAFNRWLSNTSCLQCPTPGPVIMGKKIKYFDRDDASEDFCNQPYETVCGYYLSQDNSNYKRGLRSYFGTERRALLETARKFGIQPPENLTPQIYEQLIAEYPETFERENPLRSVYLNEEHNIVKEDYLSAARTFLQPVLAKIKEDLKQSVLDSGARSELKLEAMARIAQIEWVDPGQKNNKSDLTRELNQSFMNKFFNQACPNSVAINAGAVRLTDQTFTVSICPGLISRSSQSYVYYRLLAAITHELAHSFDPNAFDPGSKERLAFDQFESCILTHHSENIFASYDGLFEIFLAEAMPTYAKRRTARLAMGEIWADAWAAEVLAKALSQNFTENTQINLSKRLSAIREAYGIFCEAPEGDAIHQSARFRIETLLRRNLSIHQLMGCQARRAAKPGCSVSGPTTQKMF